MSLAYRCDHCKRFYLGKPFSYMAKGSREIEICKDCYEELKAK